MVKQRNKTKSKAHKKLKVQKSLANAFHCPALTPNTPPAKLNVQDDKPPKMTTPSPTNEGKSPSITAPSSIQASAPEFTPLTSNKIIDSTIEEPPTIPEQQELPPDINMGIIRKSTGLTQGTNLSPAEFINDPSYLLVAKNSKDLPVVEKSVSTSFHILK